MGGGGGVERERVDLELSTVRLLTICCDIKYNNGNEVE